MMTKKRALRSEPLAPPTSGGIPSELQWLILGVARDRHPEGTIAAIGLAIGGSGTAQDSIVDHDWRDIEKVDRADAQRFPAVISFGAPDVAALERSFDMVEPDGLYMCLFDSEIDAACEDRLKAGFRHVAHMLSRPLSGISVFPEKFSNAKVAPIYRAADQHRPIILFVCSDKALPAIPSGVFEANGKTPRLDVPKLVPSQSVRSTRPLIRPPEMSAGPTNDRQRAIALANRLMANEQRFFEVLGERDSLSHQLATRQAASGGGGYFDAPRLPFSWPASVSRDGVVRSEDPYDRRPDEDVVLGGRQGEAYLARFGLLEAGQENFAAAVDHHNMLEPSIHLVEPSSDDQPDVSIIIPIYGQLPYTMNCIDSLVGHAAKYSVEIIIIDDCSPDEVSAQFLPEMRGIVYHRQAVNGGFIQSCNDGAKLARGRYIVMLNNDTRVVSGWLDNLIDTFTNFPQTGLVGSKMFYPDGSLQEAGGIIWRDGSAWNYGRDDDPNRLQYCHARQVDYVSGCSIALPSSLWHELGGFDPHYRPAYCEDADMCLRIVDMGRQVWFQPTSRVVHYEGKTSGTDTGSGVKAYQIVNTSKMFMRWRRRLESHRFNAEAPYFERERSIGKRILVIDATTPTPMQDAGSVQTVLALKTCQALGYKPYFIPEHNWLFQKGQTDELQKIGVECVYAPFETNFIDYIARYGRLFDAVLVYRSTVLASILDTIREFAPGASVIFHVADLHFLREERQARMTNDEAGLIEAAKSKAAEIELIGKVDCTITHSDVEAQIIEAELPGSPVVVWPLAVDFVGTRSGFDARRDICFLGGYRHAPNVDAVKFFVREIFPLIKAEEPDIRFIIGGANPTDEVLDLASDDVIVTGMIEELSELFDATRVFVCPLRFGAGVKGKVMSAMAHGIPIVATEISVEGTGLQSGEHLLVTDDPRTFAQEVLRLYRDEEIWARLSKVSQNFVQEKFSPGSGGVILEQAIERAHIHRLKLDC